MTYWLKSRISSLRLVEIILRALCQWVVCSCLGKKGGCAELGDLSGSLSNVSCIHCTAYFGSKPWWSLLGAPTSFLLATHSCPTLCNPMDYNPPGSSAGKNIGVGSHFLFQGFFLTQGSNLSLLHCSRLFTIFTITALVEPPGKPNFFLGFP